MVNKTRIVMILCAFLFATGGCAEKRGKIKNQKVNKDASSQKNRKTASDPKAEEKKDKAK